MGDNLLVSENNTSKVYMEMLRGRDGLPGKYGLPGPHGYPGVSGLPGYYVSQGGATYTRWGKSTCPTIYDTEQVYRGIASGTYYNHKGGGVNYLCLPEVPDYDLSHGSGSVSNVGLLYGVEYAYSVKGVANGNVPCAICHVRTRAAVIMIPAKATCPDTWYREYYGYLMSEDYSHKRSTFECVDQDMDSLPNSFDPTNGAYFYHVEAVCDVGIPCPYNIHTKLNCVVCTK